MNEVTKIILLGPDETGNGILRRLLAKHATVRCARNLPEVLTLLKTESYDVLFCNWFFDRSTWRQALEEVHKRFPGLPTIVVYHSAEESDWIEVLNAGGFDLLAPPYDDRLVADVLEHAAMSREAQTVA